MSIDLRLIRSAALAALVFSSPACVTQVPLDDFNLARASFESARDADAIRYAPSLWFSTEQNYREGQKLYRERRYEEARQKFIAAREFGEQAENAARLARHQSGDIVP